MASEPVRSTSIEAAPKDYSIPNAQQIRLLSVTASFTDNGAVGDWLPAVVILDNNGNALVRAVEQEVKVTAGEGAEVSWFPWRRVKTPCPPCPPTGAAVCPTALGTLGSFTGTTAANFDITLTQPVGCNGALIVVTACYDPLGNVADVNIATDTNGHAYSRSEGSTRPNITIGSAQDSAGAFGSPALQLCESFTRLCAAGDLAAGDKITVQLANPSGDTQTVAAFAVNLTGLSTQAVANDAFGGIQYADGDSYPASGGADTGLSWASDLGESPTPAQICALISAACCQPAGGAYVPISGATVAQVNGAISLAFALDGSVAVGQVVDPGGGWGTAKNIICGNYQFAGLSGA